MREKIEEIGAIEESELGEDREDWRESQGCCDPVARSDI
jgi:hypothetical protein